MHTLVREFEATQMQNKQYDFRPGDTVRVSVRIVEGGKERIQDFEGVCIRRHGGGLNETFTVRRISYGVGMERVFPLQSPRVTNVRVVRRGKVRRANLTYLRDLRGKKARITEDLLRTQKEVSTARDTAQREAAEAAELEAREAAEAEQKAAEEAAAAQAEAEQAEAQAEPAESEATEPEASESEAAETEVPEPEAQETETVAEDAPETPADAEEETKE